MADKILFIRRSTRAFSPRPRILLAVTSSANARATPCGLASKLNPRTTMRADAPSVGSRKAHYSQWWRLSHATS